MIVQVGIVEDNKDNIKTLKYILQEMDIQTTIVGEARTVEEAYSLLKNKPLDLTFLDIQLRKGSIFDVLERLYSEGVDLPEMIFVTAHGSFENAIKAIRFACLDFVTKPIDASSIQAALNRYIAKKSSSQLDQNKQGGFLLELIRKDIQDTGSIAINLSNGIIEFTDLSQILYFSANENTSIVKLLDGRKLRSVKNLGHYIELLNMNPVFVKISRNCLVNTLHLKQYNQREKTLVLKNGESLVASHRFSRNLKKQFIEQKQRKPGFFRKMFGS